ncbi:hypothetical protein XELAEV_18044969mg [Xenopus laevis]|uniref:Uncharacterized protein n=1 Tax=Xenopus laevis TaxID=8355 RepID=A0A974H3U5_XENLA|nr:hypothetical protein XELAEV_18044969mg [Xenopus laevis]
MQTTTEAHVDYIYCICRGGAGLRISSTKINRAAHWYQQEQTVVDPFQSDVSGIHSIFTNEGALTQQIDLPAPPGTNWNGTRHSGVQAAGGPCAVSKASG